MEDMKRIVRILGIIAIGAAFYVFALPRIMNMYRGDNVKIQTCTGQHCSKCAPGQACPQ